jgi:hypothetical protein
MISSFLHASVNASRLKQRWPEGLKKLEVGGAVLLKKRWYSSVVLYAPFKLVEYWFSCYDWGQWVDWLRWKGKLKDFGSILT